MGHWRNRPRFYRRISPPRSWYYDRPSSFYGYGDDDGIPAWEKKFCELIGSVPWQKVVEANYFKSWYQCNVISWNDSACEETFHTAKKRFWSEINGVPCDISLPDPDMYIDEINWDSVIDPELISDVEQAYFAAPGEGTIDFKSCSRAKNVRNSRTPFKQCNEETDMLKSPWESGDRVHGLDVVRKKTEGQNLAEKGTDSKYKDSNNSLNPWEAKTTHGNDTAKDGTWGVCSGNGWETQGWGNSQWKKKDRGSNSWGEERRDNDGWNNSEHQNKKTRNSLSVPSEECNAESEMLKIPCCGIESRKDASWVACSDKVCGGRGREKNVWGNNACKNRDWGSKSKENKGWGDKGWDIYVQNPPGSKRRDSSELNNGYNPWRVGRFPENVAVTDYWKNAGGWETQRTSDTKKRWWEVKRQSKEWVDLNAHLLNKSDTHCYHSNFRNSRFNRDDKHSSSDWRNVKINRKVTFRS